MTSDIWDDPLHAIAFAAFVDAAREQQGWPDSKDVKQRAYQRYEEALAEKNGPGGRQAKP
jgi:hypothetical protein